MSFSLSSVHPAAVAGVAVYTLRSYEQAPPEPLRATCHLFANGRFAAAQAIGDQITHADVNY